MSVNIKNCSVCRSNGYSYSNCNHNDSKIDKPFALHQCYLCKKEDICNDCIEREWIGEGINKIMPLCGKCSEEEQQKRSVILREYYDRTHFTCSRCTIKLEPPYYQYKCNVCQKKRFCAECVFDKICGECFMPV